MKIIVAIPNSILQHINNGNNIKLAFISQNIEH